MNIQLLILKAFLVLLIASTPGTSDVKIQEAIIQAQDVIQQVQVYLAESQNPNPAIAPTSTLPVVSGGPSLAPIPAQLSPTSSTPIVIEKIAGTCDISFSEGGTTDSVQWKAIGGSDLIHGQLFAVDKYGDLRGADTPLPYVGENGSLGLVKKEGRIGYKLIYPDGTNCRTN